MNAGHSIRSRLRRVMVGFTIVLCSLLILMSLGYSWIIEDNVFNRMVADEKQFLLTTFEQTGRIETPRFPFMTFYPSWNALPASVQQLKQQSPDRIEFPLPSGGTVHTTPLTLGHVNGVLVADVTAYEVSRDYLPRLIPWMLAGLAMFIGLALSIAYYFARFVVDPIEYLTQQVKQQKPREMLHLKRAFPDNEIGYLAGIIEQQFNRLQQALSREEDFTRDVSHELRTPTSVIKMILKRLSSGEDMTQDKFNQLVSSSKQTEHTMEVLLALAREETVSLERVKLLEMIEHCVVNHFELSHVEDFVLSLDVPPDLTVDANPHLLNLLFNNILDNAIHYASKSELRFFMRDTTLVIANPLNDVPTGELLSPHIKHSNSQGIGQGLHLVKRICTRFGWTVNLSTDKATFELQIAFKAAL